MLRCDHRFSISQPVDVGVAPFTMIRLVDEFENYTDGIEVVSGRWWYTNHSHNDQVISLCASWHERHLWWRYTGTAYGGNFELGVDTARGSHVTGQERDFQLFIFLKDGRRNAVGEFAMRGLGFGGNLGTLYYPSWKGEFKKGEIQWEVASYGQGCGRV